MATIKYILQSKKPNSPIYLRFSLGRDKLIKRKIGLTIDPLKWSNKKGLPIPKDTHTKDLTIKLRNLQTYIEQTYNESSSNGEIIDGSWLLNKIDDFFKRIKNNNDLNVFTNVVEHIISNSSSRRNARNGLGLSDSRIKSYKNLITTINEYQKNKPLVIRNVDLNFIEKFKIWMLSYKNYSESHTIKRVADIKTVCGEAEKLNIIVNPSYRFIDTSQTKNDIIIFFTKDELEKIRNTKMPNQKLVNAKKWLLLGCEIGQRTSDILSITEKNISTYKNIKVITLVQKKTKKKVVIPLIPKALELITDGLPYKISDQNFNRYIKTICKEAGLNNLTHGKIRDKETNRNITGKFPKWQLVTSKICRRTYATQYFGKINTTLIRTVTGHSTERMLLAYIGKDAEDLTEDIYLAMLEQQKQT